MAIPSVFQTKGGEYFGGVAAATIAQGNILMWDTNGKLALATATHPIAGVSSQDYSAGDVVAAVRGGSSTVLCTGTVVAGDAVLVSGTAGVAGPDTTSGSTAVSVNTIGVCIISKDADGLAWVDFEMGR